MKRNKQSQSLICAKNCEMINFSAILQLCTFYIEYKNVKFTANNFSGRTIFTYFMRALLLRYCKGTAKVPSLPLFEITLLNQHTFSPAKNKTRIL